MELFYYKINLFQHKIFYVFYYTFAFFIGVGADKEKEILLCRADPKILAMSSHKFRLIFP